MLSSGESTCGAGVYTGGPDGVGEGVLLFGVKTGALGAALLFGVKTGGPPEEALLFGVKTGGPDGAGA